jgi:acyl carrier protein
VGDETVERGLTPGIVAQFVASARHYTASLAQAAAGREVGVELAPLIKQAIVDVCGLDPAQVTDDSRLDALGVDSLSVAEVIVEVEMQLDRELPLEVLRRLDSVPTVGAVAAELERALDVAAADPAAGSVG